MKKIYFLRVFIFLLLQNTVNAQSFYDFDLLPGSSASNPFRLTVANSKLLMAAYDSAFGYPRLFATDGTMPGTAKISDVIVMDRPFYVYNNKMYFHGNTSTSGTELWSSDGTVSGTGMVAEINAGSNSGLSYTDFVMNNGLLCFFANKGTDVGLWK